MDEIEQFLEQLEHGNQSATDGQTDRGTEGQTDKPKLIFPRFLRKAGDKKKKKKTQKEGGRLFKKSLPLPAAVVMTMGTGSLIEIGVETSFPPAPVVVNSRIKEPTPFPDENQ